MIKAVLDTNVLISGIFWKGPPLKVLTAWQNHRFDLVISRPILTEYRRVLTEMTKKKHPSPAIASIMEIIERHSEIVEPARFAKTVCSDPSDDKFLEAAVAARADYIISGDSALLRLERYHEIEIVKPARFLDLLPAR